jgi:DNA polymerase III delta prime subunit
VPNNLVANLYNPHEQSKEELIANFVVRQSIFRRLFQAIKNSPMQYPEPHYLIEGPRGSGKPTLLLRLSYEIEDDPELNTWLIPLVLPEEAYNRITRLSKLWEILAPGLAEQDRTFTHLFSQMSPDYSFPTTLSIN